MNALRVVAVVVASALMILALKWSFWLMNQPSDLAVIAGLAAIALSLFGGVQFLIFVFKGATNVKTT